MHEHGIIARAPMHLDWRFQIWCHNVQLIFVASDLFHFYLVLCDLLPYPIYFFFQKEVISKLDVKHNHAIELNVLGNVIIHWRRDFIWDNYLAWLSKSNEIFAIWISARFEHLINHWPPKLGAVKPGIKVIAGTLHNKWVYEVCTCMRWVITPPLATWKVNFYGIW